MLLRSLLKIFLCLNNYALAAMEGYIVGGEKVPINKYPHSAYLDITCYTDESEGWTCGSSILNQYFVLTAAHCLDDCTSKCISIAAGHEHVDKGTISSAYSFRMHKNYDPHHFTADIGLVRLKTPFRFGAKIKRIIIMRKPPRAEVAYVAGWGLIDEYKGISSDLLKHAKQFISSPEQCRKNLKTIPVGAICAGNNDGYASVGDSGSALIIQGAIQIGIVSYKNRMISKSLVVYTDVSYYYDWIVQSTKSMYCVN